MEGEVLKYGWLIVLTLASIINIWMKMAEKRNSKKKDCKTDNPGHGERIATLEKGQENIEERLDRIEDKLNKK